MNLSGRFSEFSADIQTVINTARKLADQRNQRGVIVGGCVRDMLLQKTVGDVDLMFEPPVDQLIEPLTLALQAQLVSHPRFFTYTLKGTGGWKVDVVTARTETYPVPAQLPEVTPSTIEEDFLRRDFSINALACWITGERYGEMLDVLGGESDLAAKLIRALHSQSFEDDPTRIYRAARFAGRLGFNIERQTMAWIQTALDERRPLSLSPVRRRHEFELLLKEQNPAPALKMLQDWGALRFLHPMWLNVPIAQFELLSRPVLDERLVEWFAPWGKDRAEQTMTELSFEKTVKSTVLSKLVQSRTRS